ncbi:hypothetical protein BASA83_003626 [Batrachochytrium salamandrivorans]|nr:hypothetical protein BASA83_003626 [Batrachochytrium salamandrivorans]
MLSFLKGSSHSQRQPVEHSNNNSNNHNNYSSSSSAQQPHRHNNNNNSASHHQPMSPESPHRGQLAVAPVRGSSHPASIFNMPPKKVVRASAAYTARFAGELSFTKGDFFYVINERPDGLNYEVINPIQRIRGIVPTSHFASLDKVQQEANARNPDYVGANGGPGDRSYQDDQFTNDDYRDSYRQSQNQYDQHSSDSGNQYYDNHNNGPENGKSPPLSNIPLFGSDIGWWIPSWAFECLRQGQATIVGVVSLLNHFPSESGRQNQPRTIPFLPAPTRTLTPEQAQARRHHLNSYMQELIKLPTHIMNAPSVKRFLMVRTGDLDTPMNIRFDVSETLLDLLTDYQEDADLRIKLILGEEIICWKEPDYVSFEELMFHAEERLEFQFQALMYKDECEQLIPMRSDVDLGLLITTLSKKLTFISLGKSL